MGNIAQPLPAKLAYGCGIPLAGAYSIPPFSKPCLRTKSLATSSCRFIQSFLRNISRVSAGQGRHPVVVFRRFLGNQPLEAGAAAKGRNSKLPAQHQKAAANPAWIRRGRFSADSQHPPAPNHGGKRMIHAQSRSPDLRILNPSRPSQDCSQ